MEKIKIGVLGVSNHLIKRIILPLQNTSNCEIYGVASRNGEKAKQCASDFNFPTWYQSYDALLADDNIEAVYIPLPNHMHAEWIKKCADAGKAILCEKPIALDRQEAAVAIEYAQTKGVPIMEAFMYRYHPQWIHAKNIVQSNQIGKIQYIHSSFSYNNPDANNIRNKREFGGGGMMDIGCYAVSVPRFILGQEPEKVVSMLTYHKEFNTDYLSSAILDFGTTRALFTVSTLSESNQCVEIVGTGGKINIEIPFNTYVDVEATITITTPQGERKVTFDAQDQYGLMFEAFANALLKKTEMPTPVSDALNNMKVLDAVVESAKEGKWVEL